MDSSKVLRFLAHLVGFNTVYTLQCNKCNET